MKRTVTAILTLGAVLTLAPAAALDTGDKAPALVATQLDGKEFDLTAEKGHVVILNLWATWCGPCRDEMPVLDGFYRKFGSQGVVVFGLSEDDADQLAEVRTAMTAFTYPAGLARSARVNGIRMPRILPITYVIDAQGVIRAKLWPGGTPVTEDNLEKAVAPLLDSKAQAPAKPSK